MFDEKLIKEKRCKICRNKFVPRDTIQSVCSYDCALEKLKRDKNRKAKEWKKRRAEMKEELRTRSFYVRQLQTLVNRYVRNRDNGRKCISCEHVLNSDVKKFDAGHFYSAGHYPELRFNLDNIHGQCVECNQFRGGNLHEYRIRIIERIGQERFEQLESEKNKPSDLSKNDLKGLICDFKQLLKKQENEIRGNNQ